MKVLVEMVNMNNCFYRPGEISTPPWFWTEPGEATIRAIKEEAAKHDSVTFYLAADPGREGERIAWHL